MIQWCNQYPKLYTTNATSANVIAFQNQNVINITFYFEHTQNWQDAGGRWLRHNNFMMEIKEETERLEISYTLPSQPYTGGPSPPNDAPAESYNQGEKAGFGLDGMNRRRAFAADDDDDDLKASGDGPETGNAFSGNALSDNSGAASGAAATMMFADTAM